MSKPKRKRVLTETHHNDGSSTIRPADQVEALEWMFNPRGPRPVGEPVRFPAHAAPVDIFRAGLKHARAAHGAGGRKTAHKRDGAPHPLKAAIERAARTGKTKSKAARDLGISRNTAATYWPHP